MDEQKADSLVTFNSMVERNCWLNGIASKIRQLVDRRVNRSFLDSNRHP
jgi:hypothetical protein